MHRFNPAGMAIFAVLTGAVTVLMVSFLPFFLGEVWGPLWGAEWWPEGSTHAFERVSSGPAQLWPAQLAVPLSGMLLLTAFILVLGSLVLYWRGRASRAP